MTNVVVDITMSLDGFVTGPNAGPDNGLGDGGEGLHRWVFDDSEEDQKVLRDAFDRTGAVVMGRNLFDVIDGPNGWNEKMGFGAQRDDREPPPNFVVTHSPPAQSRLVTTGVAGSFEFVDGLAEVVAAAHAAAGERDVTVMGGGDVCAQCLAAGLADEVWIHLSPLLLGSGTPLFSVPVSRSLRQIEVIPTPAATHLHYRVV
jgi:dihydrofolate reductase